MVDANALEEQKNNCIFCKIAKGDIPAKKVYEDDKVLAVLDIHPARKGHVLVLPREHYPILPLIPFGEMQYFFKKIQSIMRGMKAALLCNDVSLFIANGGAAGQMSPHFIVHLIPREQSDVFTNLILPESGDKRANDALEKTVESRLRGLMEAYTHETKRSHVLLPKAPVPMPAPPPAEEKAAIAPEKEDAPKQSATAISDKQLDDLISLINQNNDLKDALLYRVDEVKEMVTTNEKWQKLFAGIDIDALSKNLQLLVAAKATKSGHPELDKIEKVL